MVVHNRLLKDNFLRLILFYLDTDFTILNTITFYNNHCKLEQHTCNSVSLCCAITNSWCNFSDFLRLSSDTTWSFVTACDEVRSWISFSNKAILLFVADRSTIKSLFSFLNIVSIDLSFSFSFIRSPSWLLSIYFVSSAFCFLNASLSRFTVSSCNFTDSNSFDKFSNFAAVELGSSIFSTRTLFF